MEKIYKTTGKISFYKIPQVNPLTFQKEIVQKAAIQFKIDEVFLLVFLKCKGNCIKLPHVVKITPNYSNVVSFIYCGILGPDKNRKEYDIRVEYSIKIILDMIEGGSSITSEQKNILLKKL